MLIVNRRDMSVLVKAGSAGFFNAGIEGQVGRYAGFSDRRVRAMKPFIYALALEQGLASIRTAV